MAADRLTPLAKVFIEEYFRCGWNARAAGERVSPGSSRNMYRKYMAMPAVQLEIQKRLREGHITSDQVIHRISEMATSSIADFVDENGKVNWEMVKRKGYLIKSRKLRTRYGPDGSSETECELTLYDAQAALIQIGKHLGLFKEPKRDEEGTPISPNFHFELPPNTSVDELRQLINRLQSTSAGQLSSQEHSNKQIAEGAGSTVVP